jgi:hypothetical protein
MRGILAAAGLVLVVAAGVADAQSVTPRFILSGVVVVEGGGRAWLQEPSLTKNQIVALRPGESIGPYRLTKILDDRVELAGPQGAFVVLLAGVQGPATVAAPAPKPAPVREAKPPSSNDPNDPDRVVILPPGPPLADLPPGTPRADFGSLLRGGGAPSR